MCALIPQPGANYIDIADRAYLVMQDLEKDLPEDIDATIAFDNTVFIRSSINEVEDTIFEASFWLFDHFPFLAELADDVNSRSGNPRVIDCILLYHVRGRVHHQYIDLAGCRAGHRFGS